MAGEEEGWHDTVRGFFFQSIMLWKFDAVADTITEFKLPFLTVDCANV